MRPGELEEIKEKPETMEIDPRTPYECCDQALVHDLLKA
jgi:hypothetical protein